LWFCAFSDAVTAKHEYLADVVLPFPHPDVVDFVGCDIDEFFQILLLHALVVVHENGLKVQSLVDQFPISATPNLGTAPLVLGGVLDQDGIACAE
jgi:hypothetical protein